MKEKEYAVVALKDILRRALGAVEALVLITTGRGPSGTSLDIGVIDGWDLEFAQMSREEQVDWLLRLFEVLIEHG